MELQADLSIEIFPSRGFFLGRRRRASVHLATSPAGTSLPPIRRFVVACGMRRTLRRGPLPDNYDDVRAFPDVNRVNTELLNLNRASGADTNLGVSLPDEDECMIERKLSPTTANNLKHLVMSADYANQKVLESEVAMYEAVQNHDEKSQYRADLADTIEIQADKDPPMPDLSPTHLKVVLGQLQIAHEETAAAKEQMDVAAAKLALAKAQSDNAEKQTRAKIYGEILRGENEALKQLASHAASSVKDLCSMANQFGALVAEQGRKESQLVEVSLFSGNAIQATPLAIAPPPLTPPSLPNLPPPPPPSLPPPPPCLPPSVTATAPRSTLPWSSDGQRGHREQPRAAQDAVGLRRRVVQCSVVVDARGAAGAGGCQAGQEGGGGGATGGGGKGGGRRRRRGEGEVGFQAGG